MGSATGKMDTNKGPTNVSNSQVIDVTESIPSDSSLSETYSSDDHTTDGYSSRTGSHGSYDDPLVDPDIVIKDSEAEFIAPDDGPRMALPLLRTTIEQSAQSTPQKLKFYIYRDIYVTSEEMKENMEYYNSVFKQLCEREMNFQAINAEISGSFCRTAVTTNAVILEVGYDTFLLECMLLYHKCSLPLDIGVSLGRYLGKLNRRTNIHARKLSHLIEGKFRSSASMEKIYEFIFSYMLTSLMDCEKVSSHLREVFSSPQFNKQMAFLKEQICFPSDRVVVHSRFRPEHICVKVQSGNILPFGGEQCVYGQPAHDIGEIVGNLLVHHYINKLGKPPAEGLADTRSQFCAQLENIITELIDTFLDEVDVDVGLHLVAGYAGIEILYRTWPGTCADQLPIADYMIDDLIECGQRLIIASAQGKNAIRTPKQLLTIALCPSNP